jgi:hypothetical protein
MPRQYVIDEMLKDHADDREAFEAFARVRGRSVDECHAWLLERGYAVKHRSAVYSWRSAFLARDAMERMSGSAQLAKEIKLAVQGGDFDNVADAAAMQLTQVVLEQATQLQADGQIDPLDVQRMTRSLANLTGTKAALQKMMAERFDRELKVEADKAKAAGRPEGGGVITAEQLGEMRRRIFGVS